MQRNSLLELIQKRGFHVLKVDIFFNNHTVRKYINIC